MTIPANRSKLLEILENVLDQYDDAMGGSSVWEDLEVAYEEMDEEAYDLEQELEELRERVEELEQEVE